MGEENHKLKKWEVFKNKFKSFASKSIGYIYSHLYIYIIFPILIIFYLIIGFDLFPHETIYFIFSFFTFLLIFIAFLNSRSNNTLLNKKRRIEYYLLSNKILYLTLFSFFVFLLGIIENKDYFNNEILKSFFSVVIIILLFISLPLYLKYFNIFLKYIFSDEKNFEK